MTFPNITRTVTFPLIAAISHTKEAEPAARKAPRLRRVNVVGLWLLAAVVVTELAMALL